MWLEQTSDPYSDGAMLVQAKKLLLLKLPVLIATSLRIQTSQPV